MINEDLGKAYVTDTKIKASRKLRLPIYTYFQYNPRTLRTVINNLRQ